MDEMIAIIRGLLTGDYFGFQGEHFRLERIKMCPVPAKPMPILIGGHSDPAIERAAKLGDGWMHGGGPPDELAKLLTKLGERLDAHGRDRKTYEIHAISLDAYTVDGVRRLEELGVTDLIVGFRKAYEADHMPLEAKLAAIARYGEKVIARVAP
jgi:alkanesulfonate monooxygenase SsuD/methylene tetrahydromethanopterin reductase-like flavin-dependent oxidoreductase (luciferase family)